MDKDVYWSWFLSLIKKKFNELYWPTIPQAELVLLNDVLEMRGFKYIEEDDVIVKRNNETYCMLPNTYTKYKETYNKFYIKIMENIINLVTQKESK